MNMGFISSQLHKLIRQRIMVKVHESQTAPGPPSFASIGSISYHFVRLVFVTFCKNAYEQQTLLRNITNRSIIADFQKLMHCTVASKSYEVQSSKSQTSAESKTCNSFWLYPPLWTSLPIAMHDDIENTSLDNVHHVKKCNGLTSFLSSVAHQSTVLSSLSVYSSGSPGGR